MQLTEFVLQNKKNGAIRYIKAFFNPNAPLSEELGFFYEEYEILETNPIIRI